MDASDPPAAGPGCATKLGLDFTPIQSCLGADGPQLLAEYGRRTQGLIPPLYYIPWILYDGEDFSEEDLDRSQLNFSGVLCEKLTKANSTLPPLCQQTQSNKIKQ